MEAHEKGVAMKRKLFEYGGIAASCVLICFGVGAIGLGAWGVNEVRDNLAQENIVGTPDSSIPGQKVDTGSEARAFAAVMRSHALEATDGRTYAEMGRFLIRRARRRTTRPRPRRIRRPASPSPTAPATSG